MPRTTRKKVKVPLYGQPAGRVAQLEDGATQGAQIGVDLLMPDGSIATIAALIAALGASSSSSGGGSGLGPVSPTIWNLIAEIPPNVLEVAALATSGLVVRQSGGDWITTSIETADPDHITVADGDGDAGNPTLDVGVDVALLSRDPQAFTGDNAIDKVTPVFELRDEGAAADAQRWLFLVESGGPGGDGAFFFGPATDAGVLDPFIRVTRAAGVPNQLTLTTSGGMSFTSLGGALQFTSAGNIEFEAGSGTSIAVFNALRSSFGASAADWAIFNAISGVSGVSFRAEIKDGLMVPREADIAFIAGARVNTSFASPSTISNAQDIFALQAFGYDTAQLLRGGEIAFRSASVWSTTSRSTNIVFRTVTAGTTTLADRAIMGANATGTFLRLVGALSAAAQPPIAPSTDTDTGVLWPAANTVALSAGGTQRADVNATRFNVDLPVQFEGYTVATLPAGTQGFHAYVTDALAPVWGAVVAGGGAVVVEVFYDGTNWVVS